MIAIPCSRTDRDGVDRIHVWPDLSLALIRLEYASETFIFLDITEKTY